MAADVQVGCNLTPEEGRRLDRYARDHGLRRPALCALLVVREAKVGRLATLSRPSGSGPKRGSVRVVARVASDVQERFRRSADSAGIGIDDAAAAIFRDELELKWLKRCVEGNHS